MKWMIVWLATALTSAGLWDLQLQDGTSLEMSLERLEADVWVGQTPEAQREVPLGEVRRAGRRGAADAVPVRDRIEVLLGDGTLLFGSQFLLKDGQGHLRRGGDADIQVSSGQLRHVRFNAPRPERDVEWQRLAAELRETDELVVARSTGALDVVQGIVRDVTEQTVKFEFDGNVVDLPRDRLEGVLMASLSGQNPKEDRADYIVNLVNGDQWRLTELNSDGTTFRGKSCAGLPVSWSVEQVLSIEPQVGRFVYLSDLQWMEQSFQPRLALHPLAAADLGWLFQPQKDRSFLFETLAARTARQSTKWQEYQKGLALHSRTEMTYRLNRQYGKLTATVGLDPRQPHPGVVRLTILADQRPVFDELLYGAEPARTLNVEVSGSQLLKLLVDYGDGFDTGDQLNLCDAKLWE